MKILYLTCGFDGGHSGISVYMRETMTQLAAAGHQLTIITTAADRPLLPELPNAIYHVLPRRLDWSVFNMLYVWLIMPFRFSPKQYDFLLLPAANRRAPGFHRFFTVAVVHDLSQYHIQAKYDPFRMFYIKHILPHAVRQADRVIAISASTGADLVKYWRIPSDRITVNFNGCDTTLFHPKSTVSERAMIYKHHHLHKPFILYISRIEHPGKNHLRLIQAYEALPEALRNRYDLVLGGTAWSGAETVFAYAKQSPCASGIRFIGFVPSEELPAIYRAATLYICPSLFEGFGLPIPEAMACGTVTACSNNSSLGEIAGDAALLFDPESVPEMTAAMEKGLSDIPLRAKLQRRGFRRLEKFSWKRHAARLVAAGQQRFADRNRLLGITYDNVDMSQALHLIEQAVVNREPRKIAFVNADCFNQGWLNPAYRELLTHFDYIFPDGSGVALAGKLLNAPVKDNVNGTDLLPLLAEQAQAYGFTLFLYGARPQVAEQMRDNLLKRWPNLKIVGVCDGFFDRQAAIAAIAAAVPDILLVAMGVPLQEQFINQNFDRLNCRVAMGVGGLFDFYSGNMPRAPKWLRRIGMEWLFRFLMEPRRMFKRYIIGNPVFIYRTLRYRQG